MLEILVMLEEITHWLVVSFSMCVRLGRLLHDNEKTVGATSNIAIPSARLETQGDAWISAYGDGLAQLLIHTFFSFHGCFDRFDEEATRNLGDTMVGSIMANVGGPSVPPGLGHLAGLGALR